MMTSFACQTNQRWLSDEERRVLTRLLDRQPRLTAGQVQLALEDQTGRRITTAEICRRRHRAHRLETSDYPRRHLTESERVVLNRVCRESSPTFHADTIAGLFAAETGRRIARKTVLRFLETRLGHAPRTRRAGKGVPG